MNKNPSIYKIQVCLCLCVRVFLPEGLTDCPEIWYVDTNWDMADVIAEPDYLILFFFWLKTFGRKFREFRAIFIFGDHFEGVIECWVKNEMF